MSLKAKVIGAALALALVGGGISVLPAESARASERQGATTDFKYSARDVVSFFVLGTGPVMASRPELAKTMNIEKRVVPADVIDDLVALFNRVDHDFDERVVQPVQSGDPMRAEAALSTFARDFEAVTKEMKNEGGTSAKQADGSARGAVYTINWAVTVHAGAVVVAVLGAAVAVALAIVLYRPDSGVTRFDREYAARSIAKDLKG